MEGWKGGGEGGRDGWREGGKDIRRGEVEILKEYCF